MNGENSSLLKGHLKFCFQSFCLFTGGDGRRICLYEEEGDEEGLQAQVVQEYRDEGEDDRIQLDSQKNLFPNLEDELGRRSGLQILKLIFIFSFTKQAQFQARGRKLSHF